MSTTTPQPQSSTEPSSECDTLGCPDIPVGGGFCRECVRVSPNIVDDPWVGINFDTTESGVWPSSLSDREQWMGGRNKRPFAPWSSNNIRWKWGVRSNHRTLDDIELDSWDSLDGVVYIQREDDPVALVDGDDVRCPETGEVHPGFTDLLNALGLTYADVSQSGSGVHAIYRGELPESVGNSVKYEIDDVPFGENDDVPSVEIYTGKQVCVMTGEHVRGTSGFARHWDDDALCEVLDDAGQLPSPSDDKPAKSVDTDDTTETEVDDVPTAVDALDARAVAEETIVSAWNTSAVTSEGVRAFYPTWGTNSNGTANIVDDTGWVDTGSMGGRGGPVEMALIDLGELSPSKSSWGEAEGKAWWKGVDHLRDLGFPIPDNDDEDGPEHADRSQQNLVDEEELTPNGWWSGGVCVNSARERTTEAIARAYEGDRNVLVEALPTMGKSFGAVKAAAQTGEPVSIVTTRGREEQYSQIEEWCEAHGLRSKTLPSVMADCETFNGEFGEDWKQIVRGWYHAGATGREIHQRAERELDEPLPCESQPGERCGFKAGWEFDAEDYDVLIGHYNHAYAPAVRQNRTVVMDEFVDQSFVTTLRGEKRSQSITTFLKSNDELPFENYGDLSKDRGDKERREKALSWFDDRELGRDGEQAFKDNGDAHAPLAVYTLLEAAKGQIYDETDGCGLGNGFERAVLPTDFGHVGAVNNEDGSIHLLTPPSFDDANGVVALDGTPTPRMWNLAVGTPLEHRTVLDENEYAEYIHSALEMRIYRTTGARKPYSSGEYATPKQDCTLFETVTEREDELPALLSTKNAIDAYEQSDEPVLSRVSDKDHFPLEGSNEFDDTRVGVVTGSRHFGDDFIQLWGAFAGECVERSYGEDGSTLQYSGIGQDIFQHMTHHQTLQAIMRFGRDGDGATVYVHTDTLPDWVPIVGEGKVSTFTDNQQEIMKSINKQDGEFARRDLDSPVSKRVLNEFLGKLTDANVLVREKKRNRYYYKHKGSSHRGTVEFS